MTLNVNSYGPLNHSYTQRIRETINKALGEYPRTMLLRVDIRLPNSNICVHNADASLITRFMSSLKAQVEASQKKKRAEGKRVHPCRVRYIWAREFSLEGKKHYHLALLFNKDAYAYPGRYEPHTGSLASMIMTAWHRTLRSNGDCLQYYSLVEFPKNGYYHLDSNAPHFRTQYAEAVSRVDYLAKTYSKNTVDGQRSFGCSQY